MALTAKDAQRALADAAHPERAPLLQRYFKTGPGDYAEGDKFRGLTVPDVRGLAKQFKELPLREIQTLLQSGFHEDRLLALFILVKQFERGDEATRDAIYKLYLKSTARINNWDLVDSSAPYIVGGYLVDRSRKVLDKLARSKLLWERRISILATGYFIRNGEYDDTLRIARTLVHDEHDLIHKGVGWMLREVGQRDTKLLRSFLSEHAGVMPRTMLRYAIEKLPPPERKRWLAVRAG